MAFSNKKTIRLSNHGFKFVAGTNINCKTRHCDLTWKFILFLLAYHNIFLSCNEMHNFLIKKSFWFLLSDSIAGMQFGGGWIVSKYLLKKCQKATLFSKKMCQEFFLKMILKLALWVKKSSLWNTWFKRPFKHISKASNSGKETLEKVRFFLFEL